MHASRRDGAEESAISVRVRVGTSGGDRSLLGNPTVVPRSKSECFPPSTMDEHDGAEEPPAYQEAVEQSFKQRAPWITVIGIWKPCLVDNRSRKIYCLIKSTYRNQSRIFAPGCASLPIGKLSSTRWSRVVLRDRLKRLWSWCIAYLYIKSSTISAIAKLLVSPGLSIAKRLMNPGKPSSS